MPTSASSWIARSSRLALRHRVVDGDRLDDLVADAVHRVEAGKRILEDHRDLLATDLPELVVGGLEEVPVALEDRLAAHLRPFAVDETEERQVRDALARSRLADDPERLAASEAEGEVVDRADDAVRRRKADGEAVDLEKRLSAHW